MRGTSSCGWRTTSPERGTPKRAKADNNIEPALPALRQAEVAIVDGSGWKTSFPSHQPMAQVIPIVRRLRNLKRIFFTHNGHTQLPHADLDRRVKAEGGRRFAIAYHGMRIRV